MDSIYSSSTDSIYAMIRILAKQCNGVRICHINAQSLGKKIDEFRLIFENSQIDVICVTETWLNEDTPDSRIHLNGYDLFRADRKTRGGGVAIFIKSSITSNFKCKASLVEEVEYIFVEILSNARKFLVGCVYRPNRYIETSTFLTKITTITESYADLLIAGDFNSNLLAENMFAEDMKQLGLVAINSEIPTHFSNTSSTLLDLFFVNYDSKILLYDQLSAPGFSRHDLIYTTYDFCLQHKDETIKFRDFKNINFRNLEDQFFSINWNTMLHMYSVDNQLSFLEDNILQLYNACVPMITKTIKPTTRPWFTSSIKMQIEKRNKAYARWKRYKIDSLYTEFCKERRKANNQIRKAKCDYYFERFGQAIDGKKTWSTIRDIGICKSKNDNIKTNLTPDELNRVFTTFPSTKAYIPVNTDAPFNNVRLENINQFNFHTVDLTDVLYSIKSIKSNAIGCDDVNPKFIKLLLPQILPYLTHLFNSIIVSSNFPHRWKFTKIIPVPKSNTEFRPIAILPYLSKVFERILHSQISRHLDLNNLLTDRQSGFRPKHSCATALADVAEDIRGEVDVGKIVMLVLLDHSKAFDTVDHSILCSKLFHQFNFSDSAVSLLNSYLANRSQSVFLKEKFSTALPVTRGVPQGSILGPLLFTLYANDLPPHLSHCKIHMYADDVQVYLSSSYDFIHRNVEKLNADLNNVSVWASNNGLCLNPKKSKCIIFHKRSRKLADNFDIMVNGEKIELVKSAKNLGVVFNDTLSWSNHVNTITCQVQSMLRHLWSVQMHTPFNIRMLIAKTYLVPRLLYGCEVFGNCDSSSAHKLQVTFNNIARYVFNLRRSDHISAISKQMYDMSFQNLINSKILILLHKIIYIKLPSYLYNRLIFARSNRGYRLINIRYQSLVSEWQFLVNAIRLWNILPSEIQTISNANIFKAKVAQYFSNK